MIQSVIGRHARQIIPNGGDRRTQSQHADSCDIKKIVERCIKNGINPGRVPEIGDITGLGRRIDYAEAFAIVEQASVSFAEVPAKIRAHFDNDPLQFISALEDPSRMAEMITLGLRTPPEGWVPPVPPLVVTGGTDTKPSESGKKPEQKPEEKK